jgi:hypothetical protein
MSIGEDVITEFAVPYNLTRRAPPIVVAGRASAPAEEVIPITACIQPAAGRDLLLLEEGMRTREAVTVFTTFLIRTAAEDGSPPDTIAVGDDVFQVQAVQDWSRYGGFYRGVALKVPR